MSALSWAAQHRVWALGIGFCSLLAVVAAVGAGVWFVVLRSPTTRVDLGQAIRIYRQGQKAGHARSSRLPVPGVYRYTSSGHEHLSIGDITRAFPATSAAIVTEDAGCATLRWEPFAQHMEGLVTCTAQDGALVVRAALSYEDIAGTQTTSVIDCPGATYFVPPHPTAGQRWHTTCHSTGVRVVFAGQIVGSSSVLVGGTRVPALHTRLDLTFSGSQRGTNPNDYWIMPGTGLVLRQRESVDVSQPIGPLGAAHYTEQMAIALTALAPAR